MPVLVLKHPQLRGERSAGEGLNAESLSVSVAQCAGPALQGGVSGRSLPGI